MEALRWSPQFGEPCSPAIGRSHSRDKGQTRQENGAGKPEQRPDGGQIQLNRFLTNSAIAPQLSHGVQVCYPKKRLGSLHAGTSRSKSCTWRLYRISGRRWTRLSRDRRACVSEYKRGTLVPRHVQTARSAILPYLPIVGFQDRFSGLLFIYWRLLFLGFSGLYPRVVNPVARSVPSTLVLSIPNIHIRIWTIVPSIFTQVPLKEG